MLRKIMFFLLKRECGKKGLVFIDIRNKTILDFEVESLSIDLVNKVTEPEDSPFHKSIFCKTEYQITAKLSALTINQTL